MGVAEIIQLIQLGASAIKAGATLFEQSKDTLSLQDRDAVQAALAAAIAQTDVIRPQVDAALDRAAQN